MKLEFLGTGAGVPSKQRNVTGIALKLFDERNAVWLFDCGEGTQQQILNTSIRPGKIEMIFITHLHGDHIFGLPGLLSSRSFQGGDTTLTIVGPKGIKAFVEISLKVSESRLSYPLAFIEIEEGGIVFKDKQFIVECLPLDHKISSYGYRVTEADHQGELLVDKLQALNIPSGPIYGKIKNRQIVSLPDGREINGEEFVGPDQKGRIVTILGDTRAHPNVAKLAKNADVLVHESTFNHAEAQKARAYYHSTSTQAATVAKEQGVGRLLLTHISSRYLGKAVYDMEREARAIFPNTKIVKDFDIIDIPFDKEERQNG
ncbi:ribonuclease Z [Vagococcus xieshaowenii]|uniref:Ribonuclease Z n=1 Tax=Vagococcus xieshaowenii TaxID=2562451 RepID=A0AAJ5JM45_9ENTE|nr:ribonuclease Z [Vagococcus xieshaowenii]QCA28676.1 ribonuclease Z [Vagococcus xieshaowenii]TFZ40516.1 ribonuclease Z [Vagococcus xieshaowenii]